MMMRVIMMMTSSYKNDVNLIKNDQVHKTLTIFTTFTTFTYTLNQLQANITREVAQIDPAMMRRAMLDMRARAVKCIAAGGGHFEK